MDLIKLGCSYCNTAFEYSGGKDILIEDVWDMEHENCKDFLYIHRIDVKKKREVEKYESHTN